MLLPLVDARAGVSSSGAHPYGIGHLGDELRGYTYYDVEYCG